MAHICDNCGQYCTCGGDIDDLVLDNSKGCLHCECDDDDLEDWEDDWDEDDDRPATLTGEWSRTDDPTFEPDEDNDFYLKNGFV